MDGTGTIATEDRLKPESKDENTTLTNGESRPDSANQESAVPINENLFTEDDLEGLDDELNDLDLEE